MGNFDWKIRKSLRDCIESAYKNNANFMPIEFKHFKFIKILLFSMTLSKNYVLIFLGAHNV